VGLPESKQDTANAQNRIVGRVVDLDYRSTKRFFDKRAERLPDPYTVRTTTFQDHEPSLAERRDIVEQETIFPLLNVDGRTSVFEIGCGTGRWAWKVLPPAMKYHGVDFSEKLIELGRRRARREGLEERCSFQLLDASDIRRDSLQSPPPFDVLIACGILMYLNDRDCYKLLKEITKLCSHRARIYISEAIALEYRLTLVDFYSEELDDHYSAVYRLRHDYDEMFSRIFKSVGFEEVHKQPLYPPALRKRTETMQYAWVLARGAGRENSNPD
jgi:cyclopropane fatty-acyl-phospholipid synthase-like methyltransferase